MSETHIYDGPQQHQFGTDFERLIQHFSSSKNLDSFDQIMDFIRIKIDEIGEKWRQRQSEWIQKKESLFIAREVMSPDVISDLENQTLYKRLTELAYPISRTKFRELLSDNQYFVAKRQRTIESILELAKKFLSSAIEITHFNYLAKEQRNSDISKPSKPVVTYSFGRFEVAFKLTPKSALFSIDPAKQKFDFYLIKEKDFEEEDINALCNYEANAFQKVLMMKSVLKLNVVPQLQSKIRKLHADANSSHQNNSSDDRYQESVASSTSNPSNCLPEILDSNRLVWSDLRVLFDDAFAEFKKDGRKRNVEGNESTAKVATRYYRVVVATELPTIPITYSRDETEHFKQLWLYAVSPRCVLEVHTRQDIDSDGFYLWNCCFQSLEAEKSTEEIVDKMLIPRYKGVLRNAAKRLKVEDPNIVDEIVDDSARLSFISALKKFQRALDPKNETGLMSADDLVSKPIKRATKETFRIWNWFRNICDAIDIRNSCRENVKDKVIEREKIADLILSGYHLGVLSMEVSEQMLEDQELGTFLIRFSCSKPDCTSAFVCKTQYGVERVAIEQKKDRTMLSVILNQIKEFPTAYVLQRKLARETEVKFAPCSWRRGLDSFNTDLTSTLQEDDYKVENDISTLYLEMMKLGSPSVHSDIGPVGSVESRMSSFSLANSVPLYSSQQLVLPSPQYLGYTPTDVENQHFFETDPESVLNTSEF